MVQRTGKKKRAAPKTAARKKKSRASKIPSRTTARKKATQKKAAPRKARSNSATTRSTAGPGYKFEDLTAAWLIVKMLRGEAIPGINDHGEKLQMQTKALGWAIDDLLVSRHGTNSAAAPRLSVSCKSNVQVRLLACLRLSLLRRGHSGESPAKCARAWIASLWLPVTDTAHFPRHGRISKRGLPIQTSLRRWTRSTLPPSTGRSSTACALLL